jgi:hypothetical protein
LINSQTSMHRSRRSDRLLCSVKARKI